VPRRLEDWIEAFVKFTEGIKSPPRFRRWTAVATISAAMGRRTISQWTNSTIHPNLYVILVGPSGGGKSLSINRSKEQLLVDMQTMNLCPPSITGRAFLGMLSKDSKKETVITKAGADGSFETHTPIAVFISELATFYTEGDNKFLADLTDIYDNPPKYDHVTEHSGEARIVRPCVTILGGTTVATLTKRFTETTLEGGFPSRCLLIYDDHTPKVKIFPGKSAKTKKSKEHLLHDLHEINSLGGEFEWEEEPKEVIQSWEDHGLHPIPPDPRFNKYRNRRLIHLGKIALIMCASRTNDMLVNMEDVNKARDLLLEAEKHMPKCISHIADSRTFSLMKHIQDTVMAMYDARGKVIEETKLWRSLSTKIEANQWNTLAEATINAGWVSARGAPPNRLFGPPDYNWLSVKEDKKNGD
jgi:hypothetical protein